MGSIQSGEARLERFMDAIEPMIQKPGEIRTAQVWEVIKCEFPCCYSYVCVQFKKVMDGMVEQKKARRLANGTWEIVIPDKVYA